MQSIEEQIAAATIAKIFGSELKRIDENTVAQSSNGPATRMDPTQLLTALHQHRTDIRQKQVEAVNREAEMAYPLPPPTPVTPLPPQPQAVIPQPVSSPELVDVLKSIDQSLTKIATIIEEKWQNVP